MMHVSVTTNVIDHFLTRNQPPFGGQYSARSSLETALQPHYAASLPHWRRRFTADDGVGSAKIQPVVTSSRPVSQP
jgi:hypothetical protein